MSDPNKETDQVLIWANEVAKKANVTALKVVALFYIENNKSGRTVEQAKVIVANNLINGGRANEN